MALGNADSDQAWRSWGDKDPYYGVLSADKFRKDTIRAHRDEFFASGESEIGAKLKAIEDALGPLSFGRALDFGCGVGRLTLPLAARYKEVVGLDISTAMIGEAERNAAQQATSNVQFRMSDDRLSEAKGKFDLVHTFIVLQHIPVKRGMAIISQMLDRVGIGGVISLHVSVDRNEGPRQSLLYWARRHIPGVHRALAVREGRPGGEPLMQMNEYPVDAIMAAFWRHGFGSLIVEQAQHGPTRTVTFAARRLRNGA